MAITSTTLPAMGISDPIEDGDYLAAFAYADLESWSDMYTYFESVTATCEPGAELHLSFSAPDMTRRGIRL